MLNWPSLIFILPGLLAYTWQGNNDSSERNELFLLEIHNHTEWSMALWKEKCYKPDSYGLLWLRELHSLQCPFIQMLVYCLIALPVYNLLLIIIGWHLNKSSYNSAERILVVLRPTKRRPAPSPPKVAAISLPIPPPLPPPRCKRSSAMKPARHLRCSLNSPDKYPSQKDPFSSIEQAEKYKSLRRNLIRVLEGLQQPLPAISQLPLPLPMPVQNPLFTQLDLFKESSQMEPKSKKKSRKWYQKVVKKMSKPFTKISSLKQHENSEVNTSNSSSVFQMGWQRLKLRASRRTQFYVSSASSSETISGSSCIYAY